jgi:RNA polymerase sigma-70 factor (ECF subfamily)
LADALAEAADPDPAAHVADGEAATRVDLDEALKSLPEAERLCVSLCYGAGLSHAEAAAALNAPLGTVKSHVKRGLDRLRTRLSPDGEGGRRQVNG